MMADEWYETVLDVSELEKLRNDIYNNRNEELEAEELASVGDLSGHGLAILTAGSNISNSDIDTSLPGHLEGQECRCQ